MAVVLYASATSGTHNLWLLVRVCNSLIASPKFPVCMPNFSELLSCDIRGSRSSAS